MKMSGPRRSYLLSRRATDARLPLVDMTTSGQTEDISESDRVVNDSFFFLS